MKLLRDLDIRHLKRSLTLHDVQSPVLQSGIAYWESLRCGRIFPSRSDINPQRLRPILANTMLLQVVGECEDYEYRIVGDAHVRIHALPSMPRRLSEMDAFLPGYAAILKALYDPVVQLRTPSAIKGAIERPDGFPRYTTSENVFLPLGPDDKTVDHILNFSVYSPADQLAL